MNRKGKTDMNDGMKLSFFATFLLVCSCLSQNTKKEILLPAGVMAWPGVREDVTHGINAAVTAGELDSQSADVLRSLVSDLTVALEAKDIPAINLVNWVGLAPWAERGIQDKIDTGEISIGVAASLRQRILNFTHVMGMLQPAVVFIPHGTKKTYYVKVPGVTAPIYAGTDPKKVLVAR